MRYVVYGAGAIGGVVGALLFQGGNDVTLVARGPHLAAIQARGLTFESPDHSAVLPVPAVGGATELVWGGPPEETVVLLGVKSQDTDGALADLVASAPQDTPIVCMQNGVDNERRALRLFPRTYGMCVICPATQIEPGVVQSHWSPVAALLDLGRYPSGIDAVAVAVAEELSRCAIDSRAMSDIMRWKYRKLLLNLGNAVEALCGPAARNSPLGARLVAEGEAVLEAAGIELASADEDAERRAAVWGVAPTPSGPWRGGSTWQSLARASGATEVDYLSGEIVLLGRLTGVSTPVNALLQHLVGEAARSGTPPARYAVEDLEKQLGAAMDERSRDGLGESGEVSSRA